MLKRSMTVLVVLFGLCGGPPGTAPVRGGEDGADGQPVKLFPVVKDGLWGYMDEKGKVVIEPQYSVAFDFHEGLACVGKGLFRGYIDPTGKMVIEPHFGLAGSFSCGFARVWGPAAGKAWPEKDLWGDDIQFYQPSSRYLYCDKTGKTFDPGLNADFSEGKACSGKNCIDTGFKKVSHDADELGRFSEGLVAAKKGGKCGYLDHGMKWAIEPKFDKANEFSEGLAAVGMSSGEAEKGGRGKRATQRYKWNFIDKTGKTVIEGPFDDAWRFTEGLAPVCVGGRWGYVNKDGKTAIDPKYDYAWEFSEGRGRVLVGTKHGYVDKTGALVIPAQFDAGWEFSKGLARVEVGEKEGYIDPAGKYVWEPTEMWAPAKEPAKAPAG